MTKLLFMIIAVLMFLTISCTQSTVGGGGSEVEVVGSVYLSGNEPAPATQVKLIPYDYDPSVMAAIGDSLIDTSDIRGRYVFRNVAPGKYNVLAIQLKQRTRMLVTGLLVDSGTTTVPSETLREPGRIRLLLFGNTEHTGYAAIPGTDIVVFFAAGSKDIRIDSVPAGIIPEVRYQFLGDTVAAVKKNVDVEPAMVTTIDDPLWLYMHRLYLNTTTHGAAVNGDVYEFPLLIRLNAENFDFKQTQEAGADLRFTSSSGNTLSYEIEQWNATAQSAQIWVKVDTIHGNDSTQSIFMHWGASASTVSPVSSGSKVFDTVAGFQGVWHLDETGNDSARDATGNHFTGEAYHMSGLSPVSGVVGSARVFDGDSSYLRMPNTASGKLNFPEDGYFTVSAWVYADTFDHLFRTILTKGYEQYFLQLSYFPGPGALWQFSVFKESATWNMSHNSAVEKQWVLLTGVRLGTDQLLYSNGELIARTSAVYPHPDTTISRNTSNDFSIGRFLQEATYPTRFGYCYFKGVIDEVQVCSVARSPDWIKLCYMNQRNDDKLVQFK